MSTLSCLPSTGVFEKKPNLAIEFQIKVHFKAYNKEAQCSSREIENESPQPPHFLNFMIYFQSLQSNPFETPPLHSLLNLTWLKMGKASPMFIASDTGCSF